MILPNFFCGGAAKSGTTTLFDILKNHPDIYLSSFKEPWFFNNTEYFNKGLKWYSQTFFGKYSNQKIVGEFTPTYLVCEDVPKRIANSLGKEIKFLFILRNPVDRAYSHYLHNIRDLKEDLGFVDALKYEDKRYSKFIAENDSVSILKYGYVKQGLYANHIRHYQQIFGKENIMVIIFEELFSNTSYHVQQILKFLDVDNKVPLATDIKSNQSSVVRSKAIKKLLSENSFLKTTLKKVVPSVLLRRKIRNTLLGLSNKPQQYEKLEKNVRLSLFNEFFLKDVTELEVLLSINLDKWKVN